MARTAQPSWVKHILKLLGQAKAKDPDLARFGAYSHQYKLAARKQYRNLRSSRASGCRKNIGTF